MAVFALMLTLSLAAQPLTNTRSKWITPYTNSLCIDTLSLIPSTLKLYDQSHQPIDSTCFKIDEANAIIYFNVAKITEKQIVSDSIYITYKVFPFLLSKSVMHKDISHLQPDLNGAINPFAYTITKPTEDIFKTDGLTKNGSLSRGISFGNNQDLVVNSNLNLQVSGKLTDNIDILIAATDNSIPIQAEGNTQQLQEFDKVFIQLNDKRSKLIAGDFVTTNPNGYFLKFNKKAQGVNFTTSIALNPTAKDSSKMRIMKITASAGVSKGKFGNNIIQGQEGNQGPYILTGATGELYIVVLSGSEKVYIDGQLLQRGQENDYIIDYNTAQIRFTAKQLITKDKRIEVQFQYASTSYARSMFHFADEYTDGKLFLRFNAYSEADSKNKPVQQTLNDTDKVILANAGNDRSKAVVPGIDSVPFNIAYVLYKKQDTTTSSGIVYKGIYVYSTDSTKAHFQITFSPVTQGTGNYVQVNSTANGKVYQWVAPIAGIPQGNYAPVVQLIAPTSQQMVTMGADYKLSKTTALTVETALSNYNQNTFSSLDKSSDIGYGVSMGVKDERFFRDPSDTTRKSLNAWKLVSDIHYEYLQQNFTPIEQYRPVEFQRDFNLTTAQQLADENNIIAGIVLSKPNLLTIGYHANAFLEGTFYQGFKQSILTNISTKGVSVNFDGSLLNSEGAQNTSFLRHKGTIKKKFKKITIGMNEQEEHNIWKQRGVDSLLTNSQGFFEWTSFITNSDTSKVKFKLSYKQRTDYGVNPNASYLSKSTFAQEFGANLSLLKNKHNKITITTTYRELQILDTLVSKLKPDNTLLGRIEHNFNSNKSFISTNTFYEVGSGEEVKQQFSYLQVPAGQGVYQWVDFNHDGIPELNEFVVAVYKDQADYIRVYTPTDLSVPVFTNQFSEAISIRPATIWANKKGIRKKIALFSNQTTYRIDKKTGDNNLDHAYNPFYNSNADTSLKSMNASFRNSLLFNQLNPVFGMEFNYIQIGTRTLNTDGLDTRTTLTREIKIRWNFLRTINLNLILTNGERYNNSQFFTENDFDVAINSVESKLSYQPSTKFRLTGTLKFAEKQNLPSLGGEQSFQQTYGIDMKYSVLKKGNFTAKFNFIIMTYPYDPSTPTAYDMLEALQPGQNATWGVMYQKSLSNNMTISLNYDGRKSQGVKMINTGGAQVRANF